MSVSESSSISSFQKWEQAFRIYSNVYSQFNPNRSAELIEYNHIIHTISQNYTWENVYMYDKDFRLHMSHRPQRNWNIILQQAWSLRLKDKINSSSSLGHETQMNHGGNSHSNQNSNASGKID